MTGFGRGHISRDGREMFIELKSVNHRFLDVNYRIPKPLSFLEESLRNMVRICRMKRGHLEISVTYSNVRADAKTILLDRELLMKTAQETQDVATSLQKPAPTVYEMIKLCDALTVTPALEDTEAVISLAEETFAQAMGLLGDMRQREGAILADDLKENLQQARGITKQIALMAPKVPLAYQDRLQKRVSEWKIDLTDSARIAQEVAVMADRCAIDEELSRLESHFEQFSACFASEDPIGRRMDFLLQEMNREVNTIGSKASDAEIANSVVDLKSVLEKLREQVQNVE